MSDDKSYVNQKPCSWLCASILCVCCAGAFGQEKPATQMDLVRRRRTRRASRAAQAGTRRAFAEP